MRPYYYICLFFLFSFLLSTTNAQTKYVKAKKNFINQFLAPQNAARSALHLGPLVWDKRLESYANWYANQRRGDCALVHSGGPYGENIFWGSGIGWMPVQAGAAWTCERRWYNYRYNSCVGGQQCGHYTQIVWRETKKIGCARVACYGGKGIFMTCNYDPPGNYIGERPY